MLTPNPIPPAREVASALNSLLDALVRGAHRLQLLGWPRHPYFLFADASMLLVIGLGLGFTAFVEGFALLPFMLAFAATQLVYQGVFLHLKHRLLGERARSFLQDTVLVVLPTWLATTWALGIPLAVAADFAALSLALVLASMRAGCFVGGCCYGVPARWGVRYDASTQRAVDGWRRFTPGPIPHTRVIPIQLISSLVSLGLFAALLARTLARGGPDGRALPLFMIGYAGYRLFADFFRGHRHRPVRGHLSEAQWACLVVLTLSSIALMVWGLG